MSSAKTQRMPLIKVQNWGQCVALGLLLACANSQAGQLVVGPGEAGDTTSTDILVPAGIAGGYMDSTSGDVRLQAGASATGVDTTSGNVVLDIDARVLGTIDVTSGNVTLGPRAQSGLIDSTSGDVLLMAGARAGKIDTTSGNVTLAAGAAARSVDSTSGNVELAQGATIVGLIDTTSGYVVGSSAQIGGPIDTSSGDISLSNTRVNGNVQTTSGRVHLLMRTSIGGDLHLRKPNCDWNWFSSCKASTSTVIIGANVVISGSLIADRPIRLYVHPTAKVRIKGEQITLLSEAQAVAENPDAVRTTPPVLAERPN